jgi:NAD-dependent SIR2 family protein deacetylase
MYAYAYLECPHCGEQIECEFEINETEPELPDQCPFCEKPIKGAPDLTADAMGSLIDQATDHAKDSS